MTVHYPVPGRVGVEQTLGVGVHVPGERRPGQQREHGAQRVDDQEDGVGPLQAHRRRPALPRVYVAHDRILVGMIIIKLARVIRRMSVRSFTWLDHCSFIYTPLF